MTNGHRAAGCAGENRAGQVIELCCTGDVPCGPVNSIAEIFAEEQFWVRDTLTRVAHKGVGDLAIPGVVPRLSETPGKVEHLGAALGENNSQVFRDWLDMGENELAELQKAGVI